ncbi:PA domain-containing protein [Streptomyces sp. NPDC090080]|uniref:PA domain-containing protein n=1 Tax=Streptomyces sp. NPDC090080 TaxID=3365939 RepID=UPI00380616E1
MPSAAYDSLWALPTRHRVTEGSFVFTTRIRAKQTPLKIAYGRHDLDQSLLVQHGSPPFVEGITRAGAVFIGSGSAGEYSGARVRGKAVVVRRSASVAPQEQVAAAHAAGAAMFLVVNDGDGRGDEWYGAPDGNTTGQIPVASIAMDHGEQLIAAIRGARPADMKLEVEAHPLPHYPYDLVDYHRQAVPDDPSAATDPGSLARIENDFEPPAGAQVLESREDSPAYEFWPAGYPYAGFGMVRVPPFSREPVAAGHRTDWVSAGRGIKWQQYASMPTWATFTDIQEFVPRTSQHQRWFGPITRPRMVSFEIPHRIGNGVGGTVAGFGDGGAAHSGDASVMSREFALYQGDRLLVRNGPSPDLSVVDLPKRVLPYRLVVDTKGNPDLTPYPKVTHTEWRFLSGEVDDEALPLLQLDYDVDLDSAGRAARNAVFSILAAVPRGGTARESSSAVRLEVSYDDGATWHQQDLRKTGAAWQARLHAPGAARLVSIRVTADRRDGGVTQTVIRAFGLK